MDVQKILDKANEQRNLCFAIEESQAILDSAKPESSLLYSIEVRKSRTSSDRRTFFIRDFDKSDTDKIISAIRNAAKNKIEKLKKELEKC